MGVRRKEIQRILSEWVALICLPSEDSTRARPLALFDSNRVRLQQTTKKLLFSLALHPICYTIVNATLNDMYRVLETPIREIFTGKN